MFSGTLIFAGGGTGGHLYPGLAIAREVLAQGNGAGVLFLCSDRPLDAEILSREGVDFVSIGARPVSLRPRALARFLASWGKAVRDSRRVLRAAAGAAPDGTHSAQPPVRVVAMGGYVAAPVVQAARVEHCPITLVNLDAVPGKANRWIARLASQTLTAAPVHAEGSEVPPPYARAWKHTNPIVRDAARAMGDQCAARLNLGLDPDSPTLLVTGGSQGAASINDFVVAAISGPLRSPASGWQVLHQCGKGHEERVAAAYTHAGIRAVVQAYSDSMADWWGAADLAISRAGAGAVAEAWCNRVPAVFLPYPYHRDQHQRFNAQPLVQAGGAVVFIDRIESGKNLAEHLETLRDLLQNRARRDSMRAALNRLPPADGAKTIAAAILE